MGLIAFAGAEDGVAEVQITGSVIQSSTEKRSGAYSFRMYASLVEYEAAIIVNHDAVSELYFQGALKPDNDDIHYSDKVLVCWRKGSTVLGCLTVDNNEVGYKVWSGNKSTQLGSISAGFTNTDFMLFEFHIKIDDSTGKVEIKKDGVLLFTFEGDTKPGSDTTIDNVVFANPNNLIGSYSYWDDLVVCDITGSYMNSWTGGLKVEALRPAGAGNYSQWTPSSGNNWECVDETPPSMTDHVESKTTGHKDSYSMSDITLDAVSVKAVVSRYWGEGGGQIKSLLRIGSTDYVGSAIDVPGSFSYVDTIRYVSPATSAAFTKAELNGLESGMEKV